MQEIEKILEEIDDAIEDYSGGSAANGFQGFVKGLKRAKKIIRKHMNDGWIPVEEKPSEDGFYVATMSGALVEQEEPFVGLAEFDDGEWVDGDDITPGVLSRSRTARKGAMENERS